MRKFDIIILLSACSSVDRAVASDAMCDGSIPFRRTILVILNSCTPLKARSYGLFWHFRDEKFKFKTMAVFSPFLSTEWIRTDAEEYLGKIQGRF